MYFSTKGKEVITWPCYQKANQYANEVECHVMNLHLSKDMKKLGTIGGFCSLGRVSYYIYYVHVLRWTLNA